jgi:hypothetical protein
MASNYIDDLNDLYNKRIFLKEGAGDLGPKAIGEFDEAPIRGCLKCGKIANKCGCSNKPSEDDMVFAKKEKDGGYDQEEDDFSVTGEHPQHKASNMVKQNLFRIAKMAAMLHDIIPCDSQIEEWVADKIAKSEENINSVFGYKDYQSHKNDVEHDIEIEEKTEQDLYKSINDGGETLINKIRDIMRNQPKERVEDAMYSLIKVLEA